MAPDEKATPPKIMLSIILPRNMGCNSQDSITDCTEFLAQQVEPICMHMVSLIAWCIVTVASTVLAVKVGAEKVPLLVASEVINETNAQAYVLRKKH